MDFEREVESTVFAGLFGDILGVKKQQAELDRLNALSLDDADKNEMLATLRDLQTSTQSLGADDENFLNELKEYFNEDLEDEFEAEDFPRHTEQEKAEWLEHRYKDIYGKILISRTNLEKHQKALKDAVEMSAAVKGEKQALEVGDYVKAITGNIENEKNALLALYVRLKRLENAVEVDVKRQAVYRRQNTVYTVADPADKNLMQVLKNQGFERKRILTLPDVK